MKSGALPYVGVLLTHRHNNPLFSRSHPKLDASTVGYVQLNLQWNTVTFASGETLKQGILGTLKITEPGLQDTYRKIGM